ncbi:helix-turn-helix domain-containing protein [Urechidicola vernalis]|uniref:Helix-turn-helix transcriptional regulator n=1 Tax=Urechidicola vernalis TaxID=3075600 RepID=A0ABU2Y8Z6_9FLAO|nr:helix-turn-helix transcriptional regulator [Urechidicola sp. P050]MDT0554336.1 helix-turn-helix transcriptional regulator [Urechidicola sp. P050]
MKKFNSLGELLVDYREYNGISQNEFADNVNVDVRTVQRWERDVTLVKPDKEEEIVLATLLPYQLIRNLNASVPIPTFYDFLIRKYSLTPLTNELPDAGWFKAQINIKTNRLRKIDFDFDIKHIVHFIESQHNDNHNVNKELIRAAIKLLPDLNVVLTDDSGYYVGHSIILPLKEETYLKLRNRKLRKDEIRVSDLVNPNDQKRPIFFNYDVTADCNDNIFYIVCDFLRYFRDFEKDYLFCSYTERPDSLKLTEQVGIKVIWEDKLRMEELGIDVAPRFTEGNYKEFLSDLIS